MLYNMYTSVACNHRFSSKRYATTSTTGARDEVVRVAPSRRAGVGRGLDGTPVSAQVCNAVVGVIPVWAPVVMETAHEVAIYIDRFHNLDLFQQGWYRMKIRALWEADEHRAPISPARVTQYEAVDIGAKGTFGFWKIDDVDNSFCTQPFLVKYSRQDIYLSVMVSFYIPNSEDEGPATSSVILKFELIYIPTLGNGWFKDSGDTDLVPVHEFRIPHKALLGLHSYCPVHFDALHSALVDLTIHIVYLKAGVTKSSLKSSGVMVGNTADDVMLYTLSEEELFELFQIVSSQLSFIWNEFLKFHRTHRVKILDYLHAIWDFDRKAEWSIWIIHSKIDIPHRYLRTMNDGSPRHGHLRRISSSRKPIQNSMSQAELHRKSIAQMKGHHLDLRLVRNQWLLLDPGAECLLSQINEDRTSGDFKEMGRRLANEVVAFLKRRLDKYSKMGGCQEMKLSFVGHSIGNIILRSALTEPKLQPFLKNLYTYMSISGPHLGYWYSSNSLFNSGLWLMKRLKGMQCMAQLTFSDDNDPQNTFFYKLCKLKTLENFKNIILVSSPQDGYVPYHSARIDLCHASSSDNSRRGQVFTEMLNNCLDQIRAPTSETRVFMRCDVNFDQSAQGRSLNTMIGRAAHIEFLENEIYARFIMWSFPELFR
ncbi:protein FAM135B [Setaria italica]|uniref:protein FAM135B n=1 Tax=Setaria italica TaxID=4555 RepID=UPI000BE61377|nr:protein FAM135B [Setaria italica]